MNISLTTILASCVLLAAAPAIACDYPAQPAIPDGATATKDEMIAASGEVKAYLAKVDEFLMCIEDEEKAAIAASAEMPEEEIKRRSEMLDKRFEAANEDKALFGEKFNLQVRAYNDKAKAAKN